MRRLEIPFPLSPSLLGQAIAALRALVEREDAASPRCEVLIALTPPLSMGASAMGLLLRMTATKIQTSETQSIVVCIGREVSGILVHFGREVSVWECLRLA